MKGRWQATVAGIVMPLWIVLGSLAIVDRVPLRQESRLRRDLSRMIAVQQPDLVFFGNSLTNAAIDEPLLESLTGHEVALLTVPGSEAPGWYAVLENVVAKANPKPSAVIIANRADALLSVEARTPQDQQRLEQLLSDGEEAVLTAKVLSRDTTHPAIAWRDRRRKQITRRFLDRLRDTSGALLGYDPAETHAAHDRVFADGNLDYGLYGSAIPVTDRDRQRLAPPADALVPDLADLARQIGVNLVFVHLPSAPGTPDGIGIETQRELIALLNDRGAGFVARPDEPASATWFQDPVHMNPPGRKRYTTWLAGVLSDLDLATPGAAMPTAPLPDRPPEVVRTGTPPAAVPILDLVPVEGGCTVEGSAAIVRRLTGAAGVLSHGKLASLGLPPASPVGLVQGGRPLSPRLRPFEVERDCEPGTYAIAGPRLVVVPHDGGDPVHVALSPHATVGGEKGSLTWLYPGTTLEIRSTEAWTAGAPTFEVLAMPFGEGAATLAVGDADALPLTGTGGLVAARHTGSPGDWHLALTSPPDGPFLAIHALNVSSDSRQASFLADGRSGSQLTFDLIGRPVSRTALSYAADPPPIPGDPVLTWSDGGIGTFAAPAIQSMTDHNTSRCSPVVVVEDGAFLDRHKPCALVRQRAGTQCHASAKVRFQPRSRDATDFSLAFDRTPSPACRTKVWILPGDTLTVRGTRDDLAGFVQGADRLQLRSMAFRTGRAESAEISLHLSQGDTVLLEEDIDVFQLIEGIERPLTQRVHPQGGPVTLWIGNPSPVAALLFQKATLVESMP